MLRLLDMPLVAGSFAELIGTTLLSVPANSLQGQWQLFTTDEFSERLMEIATRSKFFVPKKCHMI